MKFIALIFVLIFSGCTFIPYETIVDSNKKTDAINKFHNEFTLKTAELSEAVDFLSGKMLKMAKKEGNIDEIISFAKNKSEVEALIVDFKKLSEVEIAKTPEPTGGFMGMLDGLIDMILESPLISMIIMAMGGGGILQQVKNAKLNTKVGRMKKKGKELARSTKEDDLLNDEDFD